jgi:hypothetical protein
MKKVILVVAVLFLFPLLTQAQENLPSTRRDTITTTWKACVLARSMQSVYSLQVMLVGLG